MTGLQHSTRLQFQSPHQPITASGAPMSTSAGQLLAWTRSHSALPVPTMPATTMSAAQHAQRTGMSSRAPQASLYSRAHGSCAPATRLCCNSKTEVCTRQTRRIHNSLLRTGSNYCVQHPGSYRLQDGAVAPVQPRPCLVVSDLDDTMVGDNAASSAFRRWWEAEGVVAGGRLAYNTGRALVSILEPDAWGWAAWVLGHCWRQGSAWAGSGAGCAGLLQVLCGSDQSGPGSLAGGQSAGMFKGVPGVSRMACSGGLMQSAQMRVPSRHNARGYPARNIGSCSPAVYNAEMLWRPMWALGPKAKA